MYKCASASEYLLERVSVQVLAQVHKCASTCANLQVFTQVGKSCASMQECTSAKVLAQVRTDTLVQVLMQALAHFRLNWTESANSFPNIIVI